MAQCSIVDDAMRGALSPYTGGRAITVALYHDTTSLVNLRADCDFYQQWGYTTVTLDAVHAFLTAGGSLPEKPLLLTFDDGAASNHAAAAELNSRGMVGTFYVVSSYIDGGASVGTDLPYAPATWAQIQQWRAWGHDIQSHTKDHVYMNETSSATVAVAQYLDSKARIEEMVPGQVVSHIAWPHGNWSAGNQAALQAVGCKTGRAVQFGLDGANPTRGRASWGFVTAPSNIMALPVSVGDRARRCLLQANAHGLLSPNPELCNDWRFDNAASRWYLGAGVSVDPATFYEGVQSVELVGSASSTVAQAPLIPVGDAGAVAVSVRLKGDIQQWKATLYLLRYKADRVTAGTTLPAEQVVDVVASADWTTYTWFADSDDGGYYLKPTVALAGNATGTLWVDSFSVRPAVAGTPLGSRF